MCGALVHLVGGAQQSVVHFHLTVTAETQVTPTAESSERDSCQEHLQSQLPFG